MADVMTRIELGGVLGRTFGKVHFRSISTTKEAARALAKTVKGFEKFMLSSRKRGLTFAVFRGKKNVGADEVEFPHEGETIKIMPIMIGSKRGGLFQTILGVALIAVAAYFTGGTAIGIGGTAFTGSWGAVAGVGVSMAIGGVVQMLSPQPTGLALHNDTDNQPSYAFGSPVNTASQGYPVPLLYGQRRIGGAIISAGIYVEDQQ
jgi:Phage-related protein, tail component